MHGSHVHILSLSMTLPPACYSPSTSCPCPCSSLFPAAVREVSRLITDLDQVIAQLLDGVGGGARLHRLRVMRDEDGLCGLDDDDAFPALHYIPPSAPHPIKVYPPFTPFKTHVLCIGYLTFFP
jgi:hypothetical protein